MTRCHDEEIYHRIHYVTLGNVTLLLIQWVFLIKTSSFVCVIVGFFLLGSCRKKKKSLHSHR